MALNDNTSLAGGSTLTILPRVSWFYRDDFTARAWFYCGVATAGKREVV